MPGTGTSGRLVRLTSLEIEGFKSFRDKMVIGPLADFTCIIGPNGCGKSVVGEAIAFALGGNRKMLRAGSLASLINQERRAEGCKSAQVTLHMDLLPHTAAHSSKPQPAGNLAQQIGLHGHSRASPAMTDSTGAAADSSLLDQDAVTGRDAQLAAEVTADADAAARRTDSVAAGGPVQLQQLQLQDAAGQQQDQHQQQQWLGIRRTLRGSSTVSHIKRPDSGNWSLISQADLQTELAVYSIQTEAVDRYIVTQSRQAVDVADAVKLVNHLELLTGAGHSADRIQEQSKIAEMLASNIDHIQQQIGSLETERDQLAPHVSHWQKVQQMEAEFATAKVKLLQDQQRHGSRLIAYQQDQVCKVQETAAAASAHLKDLQQQEQQLQQQESSLNQQLGHCRKKEATLGKKVEQLTAAAASTQVQLSSFEASAKFQQALAQKMQASVDKLLSEEADHKQHIAQLHQQAQVLQQARTAAQQQLAAEQKAAAAAAVANHPTPTDHPSSNSKPSSAVVQLQQQLAAAEAETIQLQATKTAAAIKATRAAAAVAEASKAIQEIDSAAAKIAQEVLGAENTVRSAAAAVDAGMLAAQQAEQQWKEVHWEERSLQDQLQRAEAELQQYHTAGSENIAHHHYPTLAGAWPAYDNAVQHLHQALPSGSFFGRLYNCIAITDGSAAAAAVNSALQEICDLNRTLIVSDRRAASCVIDYFRQQRIGTVQCKILAEVAGSSSSSRAAAAVGSRSSSSSAQPLLEFITVAAGMPAGFQALLDQMLGGLLLVGDRQEANRLLHLRKNFVTRSGEVFKADGEIVVNMAVPAPNSSTASSSSNHPYALPIRQPAPVGHTNSGAAAAAANPAAAAAAATAAQKEVQKLQHQLAAAQQQVAAADQQLRESRSALMLQQQQQAAAQRAAQRLTHKQQDQAERAAKAVPILQRQLAAAQAQQQSADQAVAAAAAAVEQAEQQQQRVTQQLQALTGVRVHQHNGAARASSSRGGSSVCGSTGDRDLGMLSSFSKAAEAAAAAAAAVADVWQQADKVKQQQSRAGSRAAALRKELEKVQKAAGNQKEVEKMKAKLVSIEDQLQSAEADITTTHADKAMLTKQLKPVRKQLMAASKARAEAEATAQKYRAELQQQQHYLSRILAEQQQRQAALQDLLPQQQQQQDTDMQDAVDTTAAAAATGADVHQQQLEDMDIDVPEGTAAGLAAAAGVGRTRAARSNQRAGKDANADVPKKRVQRSRGRRATIIDDDSGDCSGDCCQDSEAPSNSDRMDDGSSSSSRGGSSSSSDDEGVIQQTTRRARKASKQQQQQQQQQRKAKPELSSSALIKKGKQLQQQEQQLKEQEDLLKQHRSRVNEAALDRDLAVLQALECALGQLQQLEQQHSEAVVTREQLMDERYTKLLSVLQRLNAKLDDVYKQLTGGAGSAYCAYTQERRLLFSQGVTLHVQPDGKTWRQFSMLSGGQQALATLALSFALQALSPSPFYFFDEVDCALDSLAAGRVAAYVKAQCKGGSSASAPTGTEVGQKSNAAATVRSKTDGNCSAETSGAVVASGVAAQYLLVSHRPVVFESASCLLGVYSNGRGSSAAVVAHFPDVAAKA